jgi:hypothetical protein
MDQTATAILEGARAARTDPKTSERAVIAAVGMAPDDLDVRIGAYKFYFYNARLVEALPHAEAVLGMAARRLNVAADWRQVRATDRDFSSLDKPERLFMQSLVALAYCRARVGDIDEGLVGLSKAAELDPLDRFGARRLMEVIRRGGHADEDA